VPHRILKVNTKIQLTSLSDNHKIHTELISTFSQNSKCQPRVQPLDPITSSQLTLSPCLATLLSLPAFGQVGQPTELWPECTELTISGFSDSMTSNTTRTSVNLDHSNHYHDNDGLHQELGLHDDAVDAVDDLLSLAPTSSSLSLSINYGNTNSNAVIAAEHVNNETETLSFANDFHPELMLDLSWSLINNDVNKSASHSTTSIDNINDESNKISHNDLIEEILGTAIGTDVNNDATTTTTPTTTPTPMNIDDIILPTIITKTSKSHKSSSSSFSSSSSSSSSSTPSSSSCTSCTPTSTSTSTSTNDVLSRAIIDNNLELLGKELFTPKIKSRRPKKEVLKKDEKYRKYRAENNVAAATHRALKRSEKAAAKKRFSEAKAKNKKLLAMLIQYESQLATLTKEKLFPSTIQLL